MKTIIAISITVLVATLMMLGVQMNKSGSILNQWMNSVEITRSIDVSEKSKEANGEAFEGGVEVVTVPQIDKPEEMKQKEETQNVPVKLQPSSQPATQPTPKPQPSPSQTPQTPQTQPSPSPTPKPQPEPLLIEKIKGKGEAQQAIVVTSNGYGAVNVTVTAFEKVSGAWRQVYSMPGTIGKNGFAQNKVEGDGKAPIGIYTIGTGFGRNGNPGTSLPFRQITNNDYWVDDSKSTLYNTWQVGPVDGRWASAESMNVVPYNYGFVINYNTAERIPGKGSAIFFHVWSGPGKGTLGCTAVSQENVIKIMKWLNPSKHPVIIQGPASEVLKM